MYKQIIIARKDLDMSMGKFAAQVSHASMAFLSKMIRDHAFGPFPNVYPEPGNCYTIMSFDIDKDLYEEWIAGSFTKVVLEADNRNQLLKAVEMANDLGLKEDFDYFLIKDNCLTELQPEEFDRYGVGRTLTCIGFKPMPDETADLMGKRYQLWH